MISYIRLIINNLSIVGYAIYPPMFPLFTPYDSTTAIAAMIVAYGGTLTGGQQASGAVPTPSGRGRSLAPTSLRL